MFNAALKDISLMALLLVLGWKKTGQCLEVTHHYPQIAGKFSHVRLERTQLELDLSQRNFISDRLLGHFTALADKSYRMESAISEDLYFEISLHPPAIIHICHQPTFGRLVE